MQNFTGFTAYCGGKQAFILYECLSAYWKRIGKANRKKFSLVCGHLFFCSTVTHFHIKKRFKWIWFSYVYPVQWARLTWHARLWTAEENLSAWRNPTATKTCKIHTERLLKYTQYQSKNFKPGRCNGNNLCWLSNKIEIKYYQYSFSAWLWSDMCKIR